MGRKKIVLAGQHLSCEWCFREYVLREEVKRNVRERQKRVPNMSQQLEDLLYACKECREEIRREYSLRPIM